MEETRKILKEKWEEGQDTLSRFHRLEEGPSHFATKLYSGTTFCGNEVKATGVELTALCYCAKVVPDELVSVSVSAY